MFKTSKSATSNQHQLKSCPRFFLVKPTTTIILTLLFTSLIQFSITPERAYGQTTSRRAASAQDASAQDIELLLLPKDSENSSTLKPAPASSSQGQGLAGAGAKTPNNTLINLPSAVPAAATTTPPKPVERPASPPASPPASSAEFKGDKGNWYQRAKEAIGIKPSDDDRKAQAKYNRERVDAKQAELNVRRTADETRAADIGKQKQEIKQLQAKKQNFEKRNEYAKAHMLNKDIETKQNALAAAEKDHQKQVKETTNRGEDLRKYKADRGFDPDAKLSDRDKKLGLEGGETTKTKEQSRKDYDLRIKENEAARKESAAKKEANDKYEEVNQKTRAAREAHTTALKERNDYLKDDVRNTSSGKAIDARAERLMSKAEENRQRSIKEISDGHDRRVQNINSDSSLSEEAKKSKILESEAKRDESLKRVEDRKGAKLTAINAQADKKLEVLKESKSTLNEASKLPGKTEEVSKKIAAAADTQKELAKAEAADRKAADARNRAYHDAEAERAGSKAPGSVASSSSASSSSGASIAERPPRTATTGDGAHGGGVDNPSSSLSRNSSGSNGGKGGSSTSQVGAGQLSSGSPPAANGSGAAGSSGSSGAQQNYSNSNTLNPRSRDSCSYSATIDGKWSCDSAMQEIDSNNQRSQMTMMMGTMMTQSLGSAAQATAAGAKDQATILKAAAGTQASTAAMQGIIAMQNLYGAHQLGKQATERDLNIARLKSVGKAHLNTVDIGLANGGAVTNGTLTNNHAGFISAESGSTADKIITNFQLNSHVTMTEVKQGNQNDPSWAIRNQEIKEHENATKQNIQTVSEEAIQEQTRIKRQLNGAKWMQRMMGMQQAMTAAASGMAAKQLFEAADKKPDVKGAGPVVIADSGRSGDGTPGTGSGRGPSAISGGGEGQNAADADTNSDAPPSDLGTPFAPVPGGNELADQPPPPQEKPGGQGGGNGGGGGDSGGLSASTSPASEGGDQGPGDAKMAAASTDLTYSGGGGGYSGGGGGGGGGGDAGIDLNSLLGQLLPQKDGADGGTDANGILSFSGKDAMQPYSPLSANTNIFTKISEKYAELNKAGAVK